MGCWPDLRKDDKKGIETGCRTGDLGLGRELWQGATSVPSARLFPAHTLAATSPFKPEARRAAEVGGALLDGSPERFCKGTWVHETAGGPTVGGRFPLGTIETDAASIRNATCM